jgi:hypothetical protein
MYRVMQNVRLCNGANEWVQLYLTHNKENAIDYARMKGAIDGVEIAVSCTIETEIDWRTK